MSQNGTTHYGTWIRERRKERGLSLDEVSARIRIDAKYLRALETGNIALLPEPYMRAFLRTYASFLGLDEEEASRRFESFVQEQRQQEEQVRTALREKDPRRTGPAPVPHEPVPQTERETSRGNGSAWLWTLGVIVLFAAAGYLGWTITQAPGTSGPSEEPSRQVPAESTPPPPVEEEIVPEQEQQQALPDTQSEEQAASPEPPPPGPTVTGAVFEAVAVDSTWLQVAWGGMIYVSRVVPPGTRVRVPVSDSLEVKSGRSRGMRYYFGGEEIPQVWPEGRVLTLLITRDGVARRRWSLPPDEPADTPPDSLNIPPLP